MGAARGPGGLEHVVETVVEVTRHPVQGGRHGTHLIVEGGARIGVRAHQHRVAVLADRRPGHRCVGSECAGGDRGGRDSGDEIGDAGAAQHECAVCRQQDVDEGHPSAACELVRGAQQRGIDVDGGSD